jgi:hypothetical protein
MDCLLIIYFSNFNKQRRINQLLVHHLATFVLKLSSDKFYKLNNISRIHKLSNENISLENSTFLILITRKLNEWKFPKLVTVPFKYISIIVWIYYRIIYYPCVVHDVRKTWDLICIHELICLSCLEIIKYLGFVWTLETLRVNKRYYRPLVVSTIGCLFPLLYKAYISKKYLTLLNLIYILVFSCLHHSHWSRNDIIQRFDQFGVFITVVHGTVKTNNIYLWGLCVLLTVFFFSIARTMNQHDTLRDWENLPGLIPHIFLHITISTGVYYLCN